MTAQCTKCLTHGPKFCAEHAPKRDVLDYETLIAERDQARTELAELKSYMAKVPTEPYEKRLAKELREAREECETKHQKLVEWMERFSKLADSNGALREQAEALSKAVEKTLNACGPYHLTELRVAWAAFKEGS